MNDNMHIKLLNIGGVYLSTTSLTFPIFLTVLGLIVLKDNVLLQAGLTFLWDLTDSSVARHKTYFKVSWILSFFVRLYVGSTFAHHKATHIEQ